MRCYTIDRRSIFMSDLSFDGPTPVLCVVLLFWERDKLSHRSYYTTKCFRYCIMRDNYLPYHQSETMMDDSSWKFPCFKLPSFSGAELIIFFLKTNIIVIVRVYRKVTGNKIDTRLCCLLFFFLKNRSLGFIMLWTVVHTTLSFEYYFAK